MKRVNNNKWGSHCIYQLILYESSHLLPRENLGSTVGIIPILKTRKLSFLK